MTQSTTFSPPAAAAAALAAAGREVAEAAASRATDVHRVADGVIPELGIGRTRRASGGAEGDALPSFGAGRSELATSGGLEWSGGEASVSGSAGNSAPPANGRANFHTVRRLDELVGQGTTTTVYRGRYWCWGKSTQKTVAVLVPKGREDDMRRQVEISEKLAKAPHALRIKRIGEFYTTKLLEGDGTKLARQDLTLREQLLFFADIAEGLAGMRKRGVSHNDVKPDNMLYRYNSETATYEGYVADYGSARMETDKETASRGTPAFYAPELVDTKEKSARVRFCGAEQTDVTELYAFGKSMQWFFYLAGNPDIDASDPRNLRNLDEFNPPELVAPLIKILMEENPKLRSAFTMDRVEEQLRELAETASPAAAAASSHGRARSMSLSDAARRVFSAGR